MIEIVTLVLDPTRGMIEIVALVLDPPLSGRGGTLQREGDPIPPHCMAWRLVNLVLFTVAKENRVNVRLKATKSNYCLVVPQSPCSWGRAKKARHLPPPNKKGKKQ